MRAVVVRRMMSGIRLRRIEDGWGIRWKAGGHDRRCGMYDTIRDVCCCLHTLTHVHNRRPCCCCCCCCSMLLLLLLSMSLILSFCCGCVRLALWMNRTITPRSTCYTSQPNRIIDSGFCKQLSMRASSPAALLRGGALHRLPSRLHGVRNHSHATYRHARATILVQIHP